MITLWIIFGIIVAMIAGSKGYNWFLWLIYGVLIWPIALVHILLLKHTPEKERVSAIASGLVACPTCAEMIRREALKCRFCQTPVEPILDGPYKGPIAKAPKSVKF